MHGTLRFRYVGTFGQFLPRLILRHTGFGTRKRSWNEHGSGSRTKPDNL